MDTVEPLGSIPTHSSSSKKGKKGKKKKKSAQKLKKNTQLKNHDPLNTIFEHSIE